MVWRVVLHCEEVRVHVHGGWLVLLRGDRDIAAEIDVSERIERLGGRGGGERGQRVLVVYEMLGSHCEETLLSRTKEQ